MIVCQMHFLKADIFLKAWSKYTSILIAEPYRNDESATKNLLALNILTSLKMELNTIVNAIPLNANANAMAPSAHERD